MMREGLRMLIENEPDMDVIGEAADGAEAVRMASRLKPDAVVMDIGIPGLNGVDAARQIVQNNPRTRVLGLSMHSDRHYVAEILKAGGAGYLLKGSAFGELAKAIRRIVNGQTYISSDIRDARQLAKDPATHESALKRLTPRERDVLRKIADGKTTKEAAAELKLSPKTIETHRSHIMEKLNAYTVAKLTKHAIREGLSSLD